MQLQGLLGTPRPQKMFLMTKVRFTE